MSSHSTRYSVMPIPPIDERQWEESLNRLVEDVLPHFS